MTRLMSDISNPVYFSIAHKPFFLEVHYMISEGKLFLVNEGSKTHVKPKDVLGILSVVCNVE